MVQLIGTAKEGVMTVTPAIRSRREVSESIPEHNVRHQHGYRALEEKPGQGEGTHGVEVRVRYSLFLRQRLQNWLH